MISLKNIHKVYTKGSKVGVRALSGVSICVKRGELVVIRGASGSGKSTLLNIIGLLDKPTLGEYFFDGEDVSRLTDKELARMRNLRVGFVFQSFNLIARKSSLENVMLPAFYSDRNISNYKQLCESRLGQVGLEHRAKHRPSELSGGEQQRVAIARALVNEPELIIADEPTGNLDSKTAREIMDIFLNLNSAGKTIIIVSHEDFISGFAKRLITIRDGKVLSDKTT